MSVFAVNDHITMNPEVLLGKPVIRGTRVPVYLIVELVESGHSAAEIVADYPELTEADVEAAVAFATSERERTEIRSRWARVAKFLLDANLSPKVGRFLRDQCGLDVVSLHGLGLGELPDTAVIRMVRDQQRVIITLDRDFAEYFYRTQEPDIGII
jgi:uncharacterized protein (DUF433 family)